MSKYNDQQWLGNDVYAYAEVTQSAQIINVTGELLAQATELENQSAQAWDDFVARCRLMALSRG